MPFQRLTKRLQQQIQILRKEVPYGNCEFPTTYLPTHTEYTPKLCPLPTFQAHEPFVTYRTFPTLAQEILVTLFRIIGVEFVPEAGIKELAKRGPFEIFESFCLTFGAEKEKERMIDVTRLNAVIERLLRMDSYRTHYPFDSRPIYTALAHQDFVKADALIERLHDFQHLVQRLEAPITVDSAFKDSILKGWHKPKTLQQIQQRIQP